MVTAVEFWDQSPLLPTPTNIEDLEVIERGGGIPADGAHSALTPGQHTLYQAVYKVKVIFAIPPVEKTWKCSTPVSQISKTFPLVIVIVIAIVFLPIALFFFHFRVPNFHHFSEITHNSVF